mgnify:CR=1 FL=1
MQGQLPWEKIRRLVVFGVARSGLAAIELGLQKGLEVTAVNQGPLADWGSELRARGVTCVPQEQASQVFAAADLIILSPGIPLTHPALAQAAAKSVPVISEIEFAWQHASQVPVIAITGTNGKTTTTTMIAEYLAALGLRVFCGGNIGVPYCDLPLRQLKGELFDVAVIEVSSFQLETIRAFHPRVALMLNLTLNHSERYEGLEDYGRAKFNIARNMGPRDHLVWGEESGSWKTWVTEVRCQQESFSKMKLPATFLADFDFQQGLLVGEHNRANYYCAWRAAQLFAPAKASVESFQRFIASFKGVEHRLEFVGEWRGLKIYNDAKSTNAEATATAIKAFDGTRPLLLVLGGKLRNESDRFLPELLPFAGKVTRVLSIGMTAERLEQELSGSFAVTAVKDLAGVVAWVKQNAPKGDLVFSPGHPSFDQFKSYVDRGEKFKAIVRDQLLVAQ